MLPSPAPPDPVPPHLAAAHAGAGQFVAQADRLRQVAVLLAAAERTTRWESAAAGAFREQLHAVALRARQCAAHLDVAAGDLYRYIDTMAARPRHGHR